MVIAMFGGMIGEGVMKRGKSGHQYSVQRGRDFQQRWAYYLESLRSRRYSKNRNPEINVLEIFYVIKSCLIFIILVKNLQTVCRIFRCCMLDVIF